MSEFLVAALNLDGMDLFLENIGFPSEHAHSANENCQLELVKRAGLATGGYYGPEDAQETRLAWEKLSVKILTESLAKLIPGINGLAIQLLPLKIQDKMLSRGFQHLQDPLQYSFHGTANALRSTQIIKSEFGNMIIGELIRHN